jgi:tripartite-type tricarboxylate transporter receptor subunit TctC
MKASVYKIRTPRRLLVRGNERRLVTEIPRRRILRIAAGAAALPAVSRIARAQAYPTRPITMIVPTVPGGILDTRARILAERMRGSLRQPIIIENVGGGDGSIGAGRAARARPDGYTIDLGYLGNHVLNGAFYPLQYDVLNDFAPILPLAASPQVLFARKTFPANDLNELIVWLKANPNKASAGISTVDHRITTAFFQKETGTRFTLVPYRGSAPAVQDLVAGQIDLLFNTLDRLPLVRTGGIKAYAVTSIWQRVPPRFQRCHGSHGRNLSGSADHHDRAVCSRRP